MRTIFVLLFATVLFGSLSQSANSFYPDDGWWWNPNESGRGFNIEMQDDIMFISAFHYRPNGDPVWWVASGQYHHDTGILATEFLEMANGQCAGCPYPGFPDQRPGAGSPVTIEFDTAVTGTLHWDGESIPIQRQYWHFSVDQPETFLLGEFHLTSGSLGIYFGQRIYFDRITEDGFAAGRVRDGNSSRVAVGHLDDTLNRFTVLIDSSTSFYQFYVFDMTKDRLEGTSWTFLKTDGISGGGLPFIGHRVASQSYVQSGVGPHAVQSTRSSKQRPSLGPQESALDSDRLALQLKLAETTRRQADEDASFHSLRNFLLQNQSAITR